MPHQELWWVKINFEALVMLGINLTNITLDKNYVYEYFFGESTFEFGVGDSTAFSYRTFSRTTPRGGSQNHSSSNAHSDGHFMYIRTKRTLER